MKNIVLTIVLLYSINAYAEICPGSPANTASECLLKQLATEEVKLIKSIKNLQPLKPVNDPELGKTAHAMLISSQQKWLVYRNGHCDYVGFIEGGVQQYKNISMLQCRLLMTEQRLQEIDSSRQNYE